MGKGKLRGGNQKKSGPALKKNFSTSQPAGKPVQGCPSSKPVPTQPCNLAMLSFTEPEAEMGEEKGTRTVQIKKGQILDRSGSPTLLPPGGVFQIIAKSTANPPNQVNVVVQMQATCSLATHPQLAANGPQSSTSKITKKQTLSFNRPPMPGDDDEIGLWALLNAVFGQSPQTCAVTANCCGLPSPPGGGSVASLSGNIQIFPADQMSSSYPSRPSCNRIRSNTKPTAAHGVPTTTRTPIITKATRSSFNRSMPRNRP